MAELISGVAFAIFAIAIVIGALSTLARTVRFWRGGQGIPPILWRDLSVIGGLGLDMGLIFAARAFNLGPYLAGNVLWTGVTGFIGVQAAVVYAYFELFVIEKDPPTEGPQ